MLRRWIELTKPERTLANVITASAGFFLAARGHVDVLLLAATLAGTCLVIASACVANNVLDRGIDAKMKRTSKRALVRREVSVPQATWFSLALGIAGFAILVLYVNLLVAALGVIAYIDYVVLYGYTKRHSIHGTLVGTVAGSMSIVAGYVAVTGRLGLAALLLFLLLTFWQMPHFYAIAIFRSSDYAAAKIPVMPNQVGRRSTWVQMLLYIVAYAVSAVLLWAYGYTGLLYLFVVAMLSIYWFWLAAKGAWANFSDAWARSLFKFSLLVLVSTSGLLAFGTILK